MAKEAVYSFVHDNFISHSTISNKLYLSIFCMLKTWYGIGNGYVIQSVLLEPVGNRNEELSF